ncbi:kinase-like domain, phloem protein 2-like protein, partial [Tanacetum coccineum]
MLQGGNLEHLKIGLDDIKSATENFAKTYCIGAGGYGMVYKAELEHFDSIIFSKTEGRDECEFPKKRSTVAVKRILNREDAHGEQGFFIELEMLSSCKHPNVISLLGFCDEGSEMILVYELASNGSLNDYLGSSDNVISLNWAKRIKICLNIAHGLNYLHTNMEDKQRIIHRDIKSDNILLDKNWEAKLADFGLSKFVNKEESGLNTITIAGTKVYLDPDYEKTGNLKKASDIYSFGVVLFEIMFGRLAYDKIYTQQNDMGLAPIARKCFNEGTIKDMLDPKLKEDIDDTIFTLAKGPNQDSLDAFSRIAYQCLAEDQIDRPRMEIIIKELEKALYFQENRKDNLKIPLEDIKSATQNFSCNNCIGIGGFGQVYKGVVTHDDGCKTLVAKRLDMRGDQGEQEFLTELEILFEYKHENIIHLVGYCDELGEKIIVYDYASNGSLDRHLKNVSLTWTKRLNICIDVANGLHFLHCGVVTEERVIHRDIKCANILLNGDWKAKISDFGLSILSPVNQEMEYAIEKLVGTIGYVDPIYESTGFLTKESDIYSFGVVLFEILFGRLLVPSIQNYEREPLTTSIKHAFEEGKLDLIVFEGIKEQIVPKSLSTFQMIVSRCLHDDREKRPTATEVLVQLMKALEFQ